MSLGNSNTLMVGKNLVTGLANIDEHKMNAAEIAAKEIIKQTLPNVDLESMDNLNLIVRPLALTIITNEMVLENMFSETTLEGIVSSLTLPEDIKKNMLMSFASLNRITIVQGTVEDMYSQIDFFINNKTSTLKSILEGDSSSGVSSLLLLDSNSPELIRNKISYIQLDSSKAMTFSRSNYEAGTLLDGGYNRNDRLRRDAYDSASKVIIPGVIDVLFSSKIITEEVTVNKSEDGFYHLPIGYYIDISSSGGLDMSVSSVDSFYNGMVRFSPKVYVSEGEMSESFLVLKFFDPNYYSTIDKTKVETMDIEFIAKNPLFIDLTIYSKISYPISELLSLSNEYMDTVSGDIRAISTTNLSEYLFSKGYNVTIGARNVGKMFFSPTIFKEQDIAFPLTIKDISIPDTIVSDRISERTIVGVIRTITLKVD